jgi:hypothetical protein
MTEIWTSSVDWVKLGRFHLKSELESSLQNISYWNMNMRMENVQKHNIVTHFYILFTEEGVHRRIKVHCSDDKRISLRHCACSKTGKCRRFLWISDPEISDRWVHPEIRNVFRNTTLLQMEMDINKLVSTSVKKISSRQDVKRCLSNKQLSQVWCSSTAKCSKENLIHGHKKFIQNYC